jgi:hypothetical protein
MSGDLRSVDGVFYLVAGVFDGVTCVVYRFIDSLASAFCGTFVLACC